MKGRILLSPDPAPGNGQSDEPEPAEKTVSKGKKKAEDLSTERQVESLRAELEKHKGDVQVSIAAIQAFLDSNPPAYAKGKDKGEAPGLAERFLNWLNS